jgi:glycosyltransferase involved in cell wall biosynthesis
LKASVVIPTYYRRQNLLCLFDSLLEQLAKPAEVLVVDDTPTTIIKNLCEEYTAKFDKVYVKLVYIKNHRERSISIARNLGAAMAHGDIVVFIDSDIIPNIDYIKKVLDVFKKHPRAFGVGGWFSPIARYQSHVDKIKYHFLQTLRKIFSLDRDSRNSCRNYEYPIMLSMTINCQWLLGGTMSFRRSVFDEFRFDENLKGYSFGEDFLFSNLIYKRYPKSLLITPNARCINLASEEARLKGQELHDIRMRNAKYILAKLWGFKGLLLFGRQYLGLLVFKIIEKIQRQVH